jgi:hypothetical protein
MRKALVAALGALLLTIVFADQASAQYYRWGGYYGGGIWRAGGWNWGYRNWGYRPYRPFVWGAAAALSYASYPYYSYPYRYRYGYDYPSAYSSYAYVPTYVAPSAYTGYSVPYGAYAYESCGTTSRLAWDGFAYRRVWVQSC